MEKQKRKSPPPFTEEHRRKLREVVLGRKHTEEAKQKMRGRIISEETRIKLSQSRMGDKNPMFGKKSWNEGLKMSDKSREKMSLARKGIKLSNETKLKISQSLKGKQNSLGYKFTIEQRNKLSERMKGNSYNVGRKQRFRTEEHCKKISLSKLGKKRPNVSGENNYAWIKDRTKLKRYIGRKDRGSPAYFFWRNEVYKRDDNKCKIDNKDCSGQIEAHHLLGFKDFPELRYDINNGITFCHNHHAEFHRKYKKRNNTREQVEDFINNYR